MRRNLFPLVILFFALSILNFSCKKSDPAPTPTPNTANVSILAMSYSPSTLTVTKGTIVKWTNNGGTNHTVTENTGAFTSPILANGDTYSLTTTVAATYSYHCTIHGLAMAGTLTVTN